MDIVELGPIQFDLVGSPGSSGLSVEQRKRLTVRRALLALRTNPRWQGSRCVMETLGGGWR